MVLRLQPVAGGVAQVPIVLLVGRVEAFECLEGAPVFLDEQRTQQVGPQYSEPEGAPGEEEDAT